MVGGRLLQRRPEWIGLKSTVAASSDNCRRLTNRLKHFEIGRIQDLKSEIRNLKLDGRDSKVLARVLCLYSGQFEVSDFGLVWIRQFHDSRPMEVRSRRASF
jgi:hypothetical protein